MGLQAFAIERFERGNNTLVSIKNDYIKKQIEKKLAWEKFNRTREYFAIAWSLINTRQFSFVQ